MQKIKIIKTNNLSWIDIKNPGSNEIDYLRNDFHFHPLDLEDCISPSRRPKVDRYSDYVFSTLKFPTYIKEKKETQVNDLSTFIGKNYLVTVHKNGILPLEKLFKDCKMYDEMRDKYLNQGPAFLLYEIIDCLFKDGFRMIDHMSEKIDNIEKQIFKGKEKKMVEEISLIRREIIDYRKIMKPQRIAICALSKIDGEFMPEKLGIYFKDLIEQTEKIWDLLEGQKDTIDSLQNTNESLLSNKLNETMKVLTILSMVMLPLSIVMSVYGRAVEDAPFISHPYTFWISIAVLQAVIVGTILYFWRRHKL